MIERCTPKRWIAGRTPSPPGIEENPAQTTADRFSLTFPRACPEPILAKQTIYFESKLQTPVMLIMRARSGGPQPSISIRSVSVVCQIARMDPKLLRTSISANCRSLRPWVSSFPKENGLEPRIESAIRSEAGSVSL